MPKIPISTLGHTMNVYRTNAIKLPTKKTPNDIQINISNLILNIPATANAIQIEITI